MTESNELGVVALQVERAEGSFTLRAFDDNDSQIASVKLRIGDIEDLAGLLPDGNKHGAELIVEVAGHEPKRSFSADTHSLTLFPSDNPALRHFVELATVSQTLQREASIHVINTEPAPNDAYQWPPYTVPCVANMLVSSPTANQCCYTTDQGPGWPGYTLFFNAVMNKTSQRLGPSNACSNEYGQTGVCGGTSCTHGPAGFRAAWLDAGGWSPRIRSNSSYYPTYPVFCTVSQDAGPWEFQPVNGNQPIGCGCCPNGGGVCADTANVPSGNTCIYSHPNCNTCGGGGAGGGYWDL